MRLHADVIFAAAIVLWGTGAWGLVNGKTEQECQKLADAMAVQNKAPKEKCRPVESGTFERMKKLHVKWDKKAALQVPVERRVLQESATSAPKIKFAGEAEKDYQKRQRRCLATAIYFEARGESAYGQIAVAQVVMTRVRSTLYPDTICGVVYQGQHRRTGCQFSFTCDGIADVPRNKRKWRQANHIARQVTKGSVWLGDIGYATHYHANYVWPRWRHELRRVKKVGAHIFYQYRGDQLRDVLERGA